MQAFIHLRAQPNQRETKQEQIYQNIRRSILQGHWLVGERLPSLREAARDLEISLRLISLIYDRLACEGYIQSKDRSGFIVVAPALKGAALQSPPVSEGDSFEQAALNVDKQPLLSLSTDQIAPSCFDWSLWQRCVRQALHAPQQYYRYGDKQGEYALRNVLSHYLRRHRGLNCHPDQIVIGAGIQPLLSLALSLFNQQAKRDANTPQRWGYFGSGFAQAQQIYQDFQRPFIRLEDTSELNQVQGLFIQPQVHGLNQSEGIHLEALPVLADWLSLDPSHIIFEEDSHAELRFRLNTLPCVTAFLPDACWYFGSLSKTLLPAIRLSYLVVPPQWVKAIKQHLTHYNCTASGLEQQACTLYIGQGHWERQLKRLKKRLTQQAELTRKKLATAQAQGLFENLRFKDTALAFEWVTTGPDPAVLMKAWRQRGVRVNPPLEHRTGRHPLKETDFDLDRSSVKKGKAETGAVCRWRFSLVAEEGASFEKALEGLIEGLKETLNTPEQPKGQRPQAH